MTVVRDRCDQIAVLLHLDTATDLVSLCCVPVRCECGLIQRSIFQYRRITDIAFQVTDPISSRTECHFYLFLICRKFHHISKCRVVIIIQMTFGRQLISDPVDHDAHIPVRMSIFHIKLQIQNSLFSRCIFVKRKCGFLLFFCLNLPGIVFLCRSPLRRKRYVCFLYTLRLFNPCIGDLFISCYRILHQHGLIIREFHGLIHFFRDHPIRSVDHRRSRLLYLRREVLPVFTPSDHIFNSHKLLKQRIGRGGLHQPVSKRLFHLKDIVPKLLIRCVIGGRVYRSRPLAHIPYPVYVVFSLLCNSALLRPVQAGFSVQRITHGILPGTVCDLLIIFFLHQIACLSVHHMIDQHQAYQCRDKKQERAFPLLKDQEEEKQCRAFEQDQLIILRPQSVPLQINCQQTDTHRTAKYECSFPSAYFPVFHTVQKHCRKITEKWEKRDQ